MIWRQQCGNTINLMEKTIGGEKVLKSKPVNLIVNEKDILTLNACTCGLDRHTLWSEHALWRQFPVLGGRHLHIGWGRDHQLHPQAQGFEQGDVIGARKTGSPGLGKGLPPGG